MKIGFDLIENNRMKLDESFLNKVANESEKKYILSSPKPMEKLGALWAVKEAVIKALELGGTNVSMKTIELCHEENGKPYVKLYDECLKKFEQLKGKNIEVSLSHLKDVSGAVVLIETYE